MLPFSFHFAAHIFDINRKKRQKYISMKYWNNHYILLLNFKLSIFIHNIIYLVKRVYGKCKQTKKKQIWEKCYLKVNVTEMSIAVAKCPPIDHINYPTNKKKICFISSIFYDTLKKNCRCLINNG